MKRVELQLGKDLNQLARGEIRRQAKRAPQHLQYYSYHSKASWTQRAIVGHLEPPGVVHPPAKVIGRHWYSMTEGRRDLKNCAYLATLHFGAPWSRGRHFRFAEFFRRSAFSARHGSSACSWKLLKGVLDDLCRDPNFDCGTDEKTTLLGMEILQDQQQYSLVLQFCREKFGRRVSDDSSEARAKQWHEIVQLEGGKLLRTTHAP